MGNWTLHWGSLSVTAQWLEIQPTTGTAFNDCKTSLCFGLVLSNALFRTRPRESLEGPHSTLELRYNFWRQWQGGKILWIQF